jgi:hypothetical protein
LTSTEIQLPSNWIERFKNTKWEAVYNVRVKRDTIIDTAKQVLETNFYFADSTIVILPYAIKIVRPKKEVITNATVKFFVDENSFVAYPRYYNPQSGTYNTHFLGFKVVFLNDSSLVVERISDPYMDYKKGKLSSPEEIRQREEEMQKKAASDPFSITTGPWVHNNWEPWYNRIRFLQVFKLIN